MKWLWIIVLVALALPAAVPRKIHRSKPTPRLYGDSVPVELIRTSGSKVRQKIVDTHNYFRTQVEPAAANMLVMKWHSGLAKAAQRWADRCLGLVHDNATGLYLDGFGQSGQNIFISTGRTLWNFPIRMWYMEYKDFKYGPNTTNDIHEIGHYTQVVWATTHLVGCGVSHCTGGKGPLGKDFYMYVCNYAPRIDDIEDNSSLRRGVPVAHSVYGIARSLNAANYILFVAMERVVNLQHPTAIKVYMEQMLELHRGQGMDIFWRDNCICPSEADYKAVAIKKMGGVFNLIVKLMKLFSTYEEDLSLLVTILGLHFQIRDDYGNLKADEYIENKTYCDDLNEGTFSFPIVHAITTNPDDNEIINILKLQTRDIETKRCCIKLLEKFGSFKYTRNELEKLDMRARAEIERLGGNPFLIKILDDLKNWDYWN